MPLYQQFIQHVISPARSWKAGELAELRYLREFERTQFLAPAEVAEMQLTRLKRRLDYAYKNCPYYRRRWNELGIAPQDVNSLADLADFPLLTKADIQMHRDEIVSRSWPSDDMFVNQTGGSTGAPISYYQSYDVDLSRKAATKRHDRWAGYNVGDKVALVWGAPRDKRDQSWKTYLRNLLLDRRLWLDTACITEEKMLQFDGELKRFRPKVLLAYARALKFLAQFYQDRRITPYQPHSIITSAEVLDPEGRELIETVFGCRVFDRYGCREVGVLGSECEEHSGLHMMAEGLYFEIVAGDRLAEPGEIGKIVVTDFLNDAMPLVRYEIGDMASYDPSPCPCGRGLPKLRSVAGRVTDFVVGHDGRLVSGVFLATYVIARRPSLGQVQIWQEDPGRLLYKIAPLGGGQTANADLEFLRSATREHVGHDTEVEFDFVAELAPEPSGKFVFCRSTASNGLSPRST